MSTYKAFRKWWAAKEKEGYQYGPGPLATVAFGFEGGWEAATQALVVILRDLVDPDDCTYDHHGYCQAHGWFDTTKCPQKRAKELLKSRSIADVKLSKVELARDELLKEIDRADEIADEYEHADLNNPKFSSVGGQPDMSKAHAFIGDSDSCITCGHPMAAHPITSEAAIEAGKRVSRNTTNALLPPRSPGEERRRLAAERKARRAK